MSQKKDSVLNITNQIDKLKALASNDEVIIKELYLKNYPKIEHYVIRNNGNKQDAKDIYQEAFIVLWKKAKKAAFEIKNESAIDGFIYTVAKNKWLDHLRSASYKKTSSMEVVKENSIESDYDAESPTEDYNEKLVKAKKAFEALGESCKNLLVKFYFENKSMSEISAELVLDSASTRNKKYRCMQKLKQLAAVS